MIILVHCRQQVDKARLDETIREITQHSSPYSFNMHLLLTFTKQHLLLTLTTQHYHPVILSQHSSPYPLFHPPFLPPTLSPTLLLGLLSVLLILAGNLAMLLCPLPFPPHLTTVYSMPSPGPRRGPSQHPGHSIPVGHASQGQWGSGWGKKPLRTGTKRYKSNLALARQLRCLPPFYLPIHLINKYYLPLLHIIDLQARS